MNEEIMVKFGGDLSGLSTALRGVKGMVMDAGRSVKEGIKGLFEHLGGELLAPVLSVAGAMAEVERVFQKVQQIKRSAETLQVSTQFLQEIQNVGKLAGISSEEVEKMLNKLLTKLPEGSDVEQSIYAIADKMASISDPAERARYAVEEFGKAGVKMIPILSKGSEELRKMSKGFADLSDAEIVAIEQGHAQIDKTQSWIDKGFASAAYGYSKMVQIVKNIDLKDIIHLKNPFSEAYDKTQGQDLKAMIEEGKKEQAQADANRVADAQAAQEAEYKRDLQAYENYAQKKSEIDFKRKKPQTQLADLELYQGDLMAQAQMADSGEEYFEILTEIETVHDKILDLKKKITDEDKKQQKSAEEAQLKLAKAELSRLQAAKARIAGELQSDAPTLQDFANSGYQVFRHNQMEWQSGPYAELAQRILNLKADVKDSILNGDMLRRDNDLSQIEQLKKALPDTDLSSVAANGPFAKMNNQISTLNDTVGKIAEQLVKIMPSFE